MVSKLASNQRFSYSSSLVALAFIHSKRITRKLEVGPSEAAFVAQLPACRPSTRNGR